MKYAKTFEAYTLNEGSYSDFQRNYGRELMSTIKKIRPLFKKAGEKLDDKGYAKIWPKEGKYDEPVMRAIDSMVNPNDSDSEAYDTLVRVAITNQDKNGTEPQFVIDAMEDIMDLMKKQNIK